LNLIKVGVFAGILIPTAIVAENTDWFGKRLFDAFASDLKSPAYKAPASNASPQQRRVAPAPFDSPPFPSADWQIGGTPIIGDPGNVGSWPLMEAHLCWTEWRSLEEKPDSSLRLGSFFLERKHVHKCVARTERELSANLRFAAKPVRAKSVRSLHRARA
jgi:hypothetical protein